MLLQKYIYRKQSLDAPDKISSVCCHLFAPESVHYGPFFFSTNSLWGSYCCRLRNWVFLIYLWLMTFSNSHSLLASWKLFNQIFISPVVYGCFTAIQYFNGFLPLIKAQLTILSKTITHWCLSVFCFGVWSFCRCSVNAKTLLSRFINLYSNKSINCNLDWQNPI